MADEPTIKAGDTWPPLRGRAADAGGALPLASAESIKVLIRKRGATVPTVAAAAVVIDPPDSEGFNWRYNWQAGDTDEVGRYNVELEILWDSSTTPPQVQTVPRRGYEPFRIADDLGGDV